MSKSIFSVFGGLLFIYVCLVSIEATYQKAIPSLNLFINPQPEIISPRITLPEFAHNTIGDIPVVQRLDMITCMTGDVMYAVY